MNDREQLIPLLLECGLNLLQGENLSQRTRNAIHLPPNTSCDVCESLAEIAMDGHQHFITRLDEIDQRRLHAGSSGAGKRKCPFVLRLKYSTQQVLFLGV